jgi:hypothetical protein
MRVRIITFAVEKQEASYSECVFVVLGIQHELRMSRFTLSVWLYHIFKHCPIKDRIFGEKKISCIQMYVVLVSTTVIENVSYSKKKWTRYYHNCTAAFILILS